MGSFDRLQRELTNDLGRIGPGRAQYTHLLDPADASVVDDIIVWWVADDRFDVMPNASNTLGVREALGGVDSIDEAVHEFRLSTGLGAVGAGEELAVR